jgi:hypothetical protein
MKCTECHKDVADLISTNFGRICQECYGVYFETDNTTEVVPEQPKKFDTNKAPIGLIPHDVLVQVAKVLAFGADKYGKYNWCSGDGFDWSRLIDAPYRHLGEFNMGNDLDPETGLSHIAHAICGLIFLEAHRLRDLGTDDRFKREST